MSSRKISRRKYFYFAGGAAGAIAAGIGAANYLKNPEAYKASEEGKEEVRGSRMYRYIKILARFWKNDRGITLRCFTNTGELAVVKLEFYTPQIIHYSMLPFDSTPKESYIPLKKDLEPVDIQVEEDMYSVWVKTSEVRVKISKSPFSINFYDKEGNLITREEPLDVTVSGSYAVEPVGFWAAGHEVTSTVETMFLSPDENFYGLGEKFTPFDKKGQEILTWNSDAYGVMTEKAYKNVPFFMSTKGYGIFVNSPSKIVFRMGSKSNVSYSFEAMDSTLDFYFIYGPNFKDILYRYTELTGKAPIPPKWSFGLWMSGGFQDIYRTRASFERLCEELRRQDIPCDVIHIDCFWEKVGTWCSFEWDKEAFPNPEDMIKKIKADGFKISLWENSYIPTGTKMYDEGAEKGYFLKKSNGSIYLIDPWYGPNPMALVDFTNPETIKWYKEKHKPFFDMGVDVMKTDFGEAVPEDAIFYNGETGARMHNIYSLLYNKTVFEATEENTGRRGLVWGRSGYAGSQRYPTCWSGDPSCTFTSMAAVMRGGLSLSLSGFPFWSHDIGGFGTPQAGKPTPELFVRWAQFGLFSPHSRCHGTTRRDPWDFGDEALKIFRFYVKLRYKMLPYIYSYAYMASRTGLPLVRPLFLEWQEDINTYDKDLQYMFGSELLVAPIYDEKGRRPIYLPKGKWIDYWSGEEHDGPITLDYKAPLHILPLFVKGNSIIPLGPEANFIEEKPFDQIMLDIYLYNETKFTLYDEEVIEIAATKNDDEIRLNIGESKNVRAWTAKFNKTKSPGQVKANGGNLKKFLSKEDFDKAEEGWWWDGKENTYVKITTKNKIAIVLTLT
jgi:alpha-D-xyloside xylohydrolase